MYYIALICLTYVIISFTEWFMHNLVMHGNVDQLLKIPIIGRILADTASEHLEHHKEVNMDMSLNHTKVKSTLFFGWEVMLLLSLILILFGIPLKLLMKMDTTKYILYIIFVSILYTILWNNIHIDMHSVIGSINIKEGIPNFNGFLSRGPIYDYLLRYHTIHHLQKGKTKGNFNIIFPGFDYIFRTNNGFCFDNVEYCENTEDKRCREIQKKCV